MDAPLPVRPGSRRALFVVGLSALGLLALGLAGLLATERRRAQEARDDRRAEAEDFGRALRELLRSPTLLELLPAELRFATEDGALVAPELAALPLAPVPDWRVDRTERQLRAHEDAGEFAQARALLEGTRDLELTPTAHAEIAAAAAWFEERRGQPDARDAWLAAFAQQVKAAADLTAADSQAPFPDLAPETLDSILLLLARSGQPLPGWTAAHVATQVSPRARALLALLDEAGAVGPALRSEVEHALARRARLETVRRATPLLRTARSPLHVSLREEGHPPRELLYWPDADAGALAESEVLFAILREHYDRGHPGLGARLLRASWSGALVPREAREGEIALAPRLGIVPAAPEGEGARPVWLVLLGLGLASTFGFGLVSTLRAMRREREALAVRTRFLQAVTHELRTPLASIRMFSEMLRDGRVPSEAKRAEYHALLASESERLSALVSNVLDSARDDPAGRALDLRRVPVRAFASELALLLRPYVEREGLRFELTIDTEIDEDDEALVDRDAFVQALWNLAANALAHGRSGGLLRLALRRAGEQLRFSVEDDGPGVPREERERIFEALTRGRAAQESGTPGLGLGLPLARRLVAAQGGTLELVESARGACFCIALPRYAKDAPRCP